MREKRRKGENERQGLFVHGHNVNALIQSQISCASSAWLKFPFHYYWAEIIEVYILYLLISVARLLALSDVL